MNKAAYYAQCVYSDVRNYQELKSSKSDIAPWGGLELDQLMDLVQEVGRTCELILFGARTVQDFNIAWPTVSDRNLFQCEKAFGLAIACLHKQFPNKKSAIKKAFKAWNTAWTNVDSQAGVACPELPDKDLVKEMLRASEDRCEGRASQAHDQEAGEQEAGEQEEPQEEVQEEKSKPKKKRPKKVEESVEDPTLLVGPSMAETLKEHRSKWARVPKGTRLSLLEQKEKPQSFRYRDAIDMDKDLVSLKSLALWRVFRTLNILATIATMRVCQP